VVYRLKYDNLRSAAATLTGLLGDYLKDNPVPGDVLVPVPLHPQRLRQRGYNQSKLLADGLGKIAGLPVSDNCLKRQRPANPQAKADSLEQRRRNVADAFAARGDLRGKRLILIDDVATSGATLDAAAAALKSAGSASVWGLTLAREV
jgi:ComF family protein